MSAAAQGVRGVVERRLDEDEKLDDATGLVILAALTGDATLAAELDGAGAPGEPETPLVDDAAPTAGSYLASITVEGFRGVGPETTLDLSPGPGLTLVVGRNGSGKSSFAEAAELAVTSDNRRWSGRTGVWREGWRNLHEPVSTRVAVQLGGDGPPVTVARTWAPTDDLDGGSWTRQVRGEKLQAVATAGEAVTTYRPFLSYSELGTLIDGKPSETYDALHTLLGLGELTTAHRRLTEARKAEEQLPKAAETARKTLLAQVGGLDDERARRAAEVLRVRAVDLDALADLALGTDDDAATVSRLRAVAALSLPSAEDVRTAARELDEARAAHLASSSAQARASAGLARLLRAALDHHDEHGEVDCPVCGAGLLDDGWRADAQRRVADAEHGARTVGDAASRVEQASTDLARLVAVPPLDVLTGAPVATDDVADAWGRWHAADGAAALDDADRALRPALASLVDAAEQELERRDLAWRPIAIALAGLHEQLTQAAARTARLARLKKAEAWVKAAEAAIRDERVTPLAEHSQQVWNELRQQSTVDLAPIRLEGASTRRRATLDVTVDGVESAALSVMSQGELHSLALSLFLPRATVDDSPFRFVLVDDPVQAMDPAKVDGLTAVLSRIARERQVVVFSHDDRLAESVRRSQVPATVVEVVRHERSAVELRPCGDPVARHLDDARALVRSDHVPPDILSEIVATTCRSALEAASHARFRRDCLRRGDDHADVERRLADAHRLRQVLTLALLGDEDRHGDLDDQLRRAGGRAVAVVRACAKGAHRGYGGDLRTLVEDVGTLCAWIGRS